MYRQVELLSGSSVNKFLKKKGNDVQRITPVVTPYEIKYVVEYVVMEATPREVIEAFTQ